MERAKRILCLALCFAMLAGYVPVPTHAEDLSQQGLCAHHPEHIDCSYAPAVEAMACGHQHDDPCYTIEEHCTHVHGDCSTEEVPCEHVCSEEDGCFAKTLNCQHEHDEVCGYVESREAVACDFVCTDCGSQEDPITCDGTQDCSAEEHSEGCEKNLTEEQTKKETVTEEAVADQKNEDQAAADEVAALIEALPSVSTIQQKLLANQMDDYDQVQMAYEAYEKLTDDQKALLPFTENIFKPYFEYFNGQTSTVATSGTCGDDAKWYISGKTLVIYGSGDMYDYEADTAPWEPNISSGTSSGANITSIQISDQITSIGDYAFYNNMGITSIRIGSGVQRIGESSCQFAQLVALELPNSLKVIEDYAFAWCYALKEVNLPESLEILEEGSFYGCESLTSIHIPASVQEFFLDANVLKTGVFSGCKGITEFTVDHENPILSAQDGVLFNKDKTCLVQYPLGSSRTEYTIPKDVSSIGCSAFGRCQNLKNITVPSSVTEIQEYAFFYSPSLKEITFQGDAPEIYASSMFADNKMTVYYPLGNTTWTENVMQNYGGTVTWTPKGPNGEQGGFHGDNIIWMFDKNTGTLTISGIGAITWTYGGNYYPWGGYVNEITKVIVKDGITEIPSYTFEYMESAESITLPNTLTTLALNAFNDCGSLDNLLIPASVQTIEGISSIDNPEFIRCESLRNVYYLGTEKEWLSIPKAEYVVNNSAEMTMHFLTLHESTVSCTEAGTESYYQFDDTSVYAGMYNMDKEPICQLELLPALGHTEVVDEAVDATCTKDGLTEGRHCSVCGEVIVAQEVIPAEHVVENGICTRCKAYGTHGDNLTWEFNETDGTFTISGSGVMQDIGSYYSSWSDYVEQITAVVINEGVTSIGRLAFDDCVNLKTVSVPGSVLCIGEGAFVGCKNLEIVVLSEGLEEIGKQAFTGCDSLKEIQLPKTLTTIRTAAFSNCDSLVEIKIPDSVTELEQGIFRVSGISCVELPENLTVIPTGIFYECKNLTEIQWPSAVTCIDASAFAHSGLSQITIPASITAIDDTAFAGSALKTVTFLGDPPTFGDEVFNNVIADVYYYDNGKWNSNNMRQYDGVLNWIPMSNPVTSGICGDNLTWTYRDGTLTVSGTGAMYDYSQDQTSPAPWAIWGGDIKTLVVEEGITEIGDFAFTSCSVIENASFPSTLTRVGEYAFYKLTRPDGNMYHRAFWSEINQTVRQWSQITFEAENEGFPGGDSTKFVHSAPITASGKYGDKVFWELNENGTMEFFGSGDMDEFGATGSWLYDLRASTIIISEGITNIGMNAFETYGEDPLCVSLETVRVASTVKRVEEMAFAGCQALNIITFTGDAPTFGENCFRDVTATVCYPAGNVTWTDAVMQDYEGSITWMGYDDPSEPIEPTEPPESTDPIEPTDPVEPVFPMTGTVTTLLNVRSAPSQSADIVDKLQPGTKVEILRIETISDVEWGLIDTGWIMMHYVDLGDGSGTTDNTCGKDLIWSFDKDTGVLSISGTGAMTDFTVKQENPGYGLKPTDSPWLAIEDQVLEIVIKEGVTTIGTGAFANFENLSKVSLPDSLVSIGNHAFNTDTSLTELRIPDGVTYLGDFAFAVCVNLPRVTLPMGITRIGESALDQCLALETLTIPANVTSIGYKALAYCTNLREVTFEGNAPSFDEAAFHGSNFTAYYQQKDSTWIPDVMQNYGGTVSWEAIYDTYTVTLDYQDPMVYNEIWEYTPGTTFALPTNLVRSGYIFLGWHEGDTKVTEIPADATGDKYYVAKWQEKEAISINTTAQNYAYDGDGKAFVLKDTNGNLLPVAAETDWLVPCSYTAVTVPFGERESAVTGASTFHQGIDLDTGTGWDVVASRAGTVVTAGWGDAAGNYVQINHGDGFSSIYMHLSSIGVSAGQHVSAGQYIGATGNTGVAADDHLHFGISLNGEYVNPELYVKLDGSNAKFFIDYTYSGVELNENGLPYHPGIYGIRVTRPETATHKAVDLVINPAIRIVSNSGFCGYDLYWEFAPASGILTISGNGSMYDYSVEDPAPWNVYASVIKEICFDSESISIGDCAFADCTALTAISIPDNVYRIGAEAFSGCTELNTITFTGDSPYMEENAFAGVTATAYYPAGWGWYEDDFADYGGKITWIETGEIAKRLIASFPFTLTPGLTGSVYANVRPWNAIKDCVFSVSDPTVLEIISTNSEYIEFKAIGAGTATITITERNSGLQYSGEVTVVESQPITIPCSMELQIPEGDTQRYFSFTPEVSGTYQFSFTEIERMTLSYGGYGDPIIIYSNGEWVDANYSIDDEAPFASANLNAGTNYIIMLPYYMSAYEQTSLFTAEEVSADSTEKGKLYFYEEQREIEFLPGDSEGYHQSVYYNGTAPLSWRSSNPSVLEIAEVDAEYNNCRFVINSEGTAVITVTNGDLSDSMTVTTKAMEFAELYLPITETPETDYLHTSYAFVAPEAGRYVFSVSADDGEVSIGFNSSSSIAKVMYSYGENSCAAFKTMKEDEICRFYVRSNASSYTVRVSKASAKPLSMKLIATESYADTIRFGASFAPANACDRVIKWEIDNREIASEVNNPDRYSNNRNEMSYEIYGEGTLTVTATSESGLKASITVKVTPPDPDCLYTHTFGEWTPVLDQDGTEIDRERRTCIYCGVYQERRIPPLNDSVPNRLVVDAEVLAGQNIVWIDGVEYALQKNGDKCYVDLPDSNARTMIVHTYNSNSSNRYPISMKVWILENQNGIYTATRQEVFDNILQYSGMSIRVTGKKGIRMVTAIEKDKKNSLVSDGLEGYTLKEYGTVVAWASKLTDGNPLVLGQSYALSNYAYRKNVADPVFAYSGSLMQYTNVLVNFTNEQCKNELALRPYMILEDQNGETFTIYGGIVYRSIGYIAYQNRNTFEPGTAEYTYIWDIIHYVYGDVYDDEFVHSWSPIIK